MTNDLEKTATAILEIDTGALARNIQLLQQKAPKAKMAGVVKANAYGIGVAETLPVFKNCGLQTFFVATLEEGIALRQNAGAGVEIGILGGLFPGAEDVYVELKLTPVLNSLEEAGRWRGGHDAMLHIDTGMRRLGLDRVDTQKIIDDPDVLRGVKITTILSHFACADEPGHALTVQQYKAFSAIAKIFPEARKSLSNSAGIFASAEYHFDLVRPGMAVYGLNPTTGVNPMEAVVQLKVRVLQVRDVTKGESVGYGATWVAGSDRRVATVALGYADGFLRSLSNQGVLFYQGVACPIAGRVSMDLVTVDITAAPGVKAGDWMEVLGAKQSADDLARAAGTIGYEILTSLGQRYRRVYRNGPAKPFESKAVSG